MNAFDKFLAMIGMSQERYQTMSEAEQAQLTTVSNNLEASETARIEAETALAAVNTQVDDLTAQLATALENESAVQGGLTQTESALEQANTIITGLEAKVASLNVELSKKPAEAGTAVIKTGEPQPGEKKKVLRSWEIPLHS